MSLPESRNRTYTSASPAVSADLNDIQDQIIYLNSGHGVRERTVSPWAGVQLVGSFLDLPPRWRASATSQNYRVPLPLKAGDRLTEVRYTSSRDATNPTFHDIYLVDADTSQSNPAGWYGSISPTTGTITQTFVAGTAHTVLPGQLVFFQYTSGQTQDVLYSISIEFDRPAS